MAAPCTHGMPTAASCWDCMEDGNLDPPPPPPTPDVAAWMGWARYDDHCDGCNLAVHVGQQIVRMTDDTYQHFACAVTS